MHSKPKSIPFYEALSLIDKMHKEGLFSSYAVGGAFAAYLFIEPAGTDDIDVFLNREAFGPGPLLSMEPLYAYLRANGAEEHKEYMKIMGWDLQLLPPPNQLYEEAIANPIRMKIGDLEVPVFSPEYLAAIALQTGRSKDIDRFSQLIRSGAVDEMKLNDILKRYEIKVPVQKNRTREKGDRSWID